MCPEIIEPGLDEESQAIGEDEKRQLDVSPGEYRLVRHAAREVKKEHPSMVHRDFRKEVIRRLGEWPLPPDEELEKVEARITNRFIRNIQIGEPGSSSCFDAPHGIEPIAEELAKNFYEIPRLRDKLPEELRDRSTTEISQYIVQGIREVQQQLGEKGIDLGALPDNWRGEFNDFDALIVDNLKTFEVGTDEIAKKAAQQTGSSSFQWRRSRISYDPNARSGEYYYVDQEKGKEFLGYPNEAQAAGDLAIERIMQQTSEIDEGGKVTQPFIHISLHRQFDLESRPGIIIADGIKNGKTPCHPAVARRCAEILADEISNRKLTHPDGREITIRVHHEGMDLCGSSENVRRRFGGEVHQGFGELYQCLQTEVKAELLKHFPTELADIFAVVISRMHEELATKEQYDNFIKTYATEEEKNAEAGIKRPVNKPEEKVAETGETLKPRLFEPRFRSAEDVPPGYISCNGPCRTEIGVYDRFDAGETVVVWVRPEGGKEWYQYTVRKARKSFAGNNKPSFCDSEQEKLGNGHVEIRTISPEQSESSV